MVLNRDFITYLSALRNRAVFDLRYCLSFDSYKAFAIINQLVHFPTLGGIDFIVDQSFDLSLLRPVVIKAREFAHTRLIFYPNDIVPKLPVNFSYFDSIDLNFQNLFLSQLQVIIEDLVSLQEKHQFLHCFVNQIVYSSLLLDDFLRIYVDNNHVLFFDDLLNAPSPSAPCSIQNKHCLSRRMFPVFDGSLNLKTCSLYNKEALTGLSFEMLPSTIFTALRNDLCKKCIRLGLHRV